jgi:hypothetical protein
LIAYEDRETESADWSATFGDDAVGLAVYETGGALAIQIMPGSDVESGYLGYFGTYAITEATSSDSGIVGVVEHRVEGSTHPELASTGGRPFELTGDRLMLGDGRTWRRILERIPPS